LKIKNEKELLQVFLQDLFSTQKITYQSIQYFQENQTKTHFINQRWMKW